MLKSGARIDAQRMADEAILRTRGQEDRITQTEGLKESGSQERQTIQTRGTEDRSTLQTSGSEDRKTIETTGAQERETIGKTAEEGRTTIDFSDQIEARKEGRADARSKALARR